MLDKGGEEKLDLSVDRLYPFDARLDASKLVDREKLRAVKDRRLAQLMLDSWGLVERNERDPHFAAREANREKRRGERELEQLKELADEARRGVFGLRGKEIWNTVTGEGKDTSKGALLELSKSLRGKPRVK